MSAPGVLERARDAASRRAWQDAHRLFAEAEHAGLLPPGELPLVAQVAYAAGHLDVTIETWERIHAESVRAGQPLAAAGAAVRVALHLLLDTALMAPVRGWLARAERHLEGLGETPVHAWLAVVRHYERMLAGDAAGARTWAQQAIALGGRHDPAAAAIGRVAEARGLMLAGEVQRGLVLLEEAGVATTSGELDPLSTGVVFCELVCALQGLAQFDLAEEWTDMMERWCATNAIGSLHGRCRVHRAEILRLRGHLDDAERQVLLACEELRPYLRRELGWPLVELGRIRLHKGDLDGAEEALLAAHDAGWDAQPGLARVQLARGEVALAGASLREALERPSSVPSKELPPHSDLRRAPLLETEVEVAVAAGDLARARAACTELQGVALRFESKALVAGATHAQAGVCLAEGDGAQAQRLFEQASRLWQEVGAPYEAALARRGLAGAHEAQGNVHAAALERRAVRAALAQLGAVEPAGLVAPAEAAPAPTAETRAPDLGVFRREGDVWTLTFAGHTVRMRDLKGLHYVARLLAEPYRELHGLDLVAGVQGGPVPQEGPAAVAEATSLGLGDAGPVLDARAKAAYRRRLEEIAEDLEEAQARGDAARRAQAEAEQELLVRELSRAVGLGGRDRRVGSASERARASVTRAVRQALLRLGEHHPALAAYLDRTVRTGTFCAYVPDARVPVRWQL